MHRLILGKLSFMLIPIKIFVINIFAPHRLQQREKLIFVHESQNQHKTKLTKTWISTSSVSAFYNRYADPTLETDDNEFSCLVFTLEFSRQPTYFVMNVIMPSVLINCLCVLNFGVPHETGEKVGYGITVFLAQSVNLMVVSEMMPQGTYYLLNFLYNRGASRFSQGEGRPN